MNDFWGTWSGKKVQWRRRWLRTRLLRIDGEPRQKNSRGARQHMAATQRHLQEQMTPLRQHAFTGPVAVDLDFHVTTRQPPAIYKLAKYLLDVLAVTLEEERTRGRHHVLYRDDRQIKLLYVHLWPPPVNNANGEAGKVGHTWVTARPLRDVVEDLRLASELTTATHIPSSWDDDDDRSPFHRPVVPDIDTEPTFDPNLATTPDEAQRWEDLNVWLTLHDRSQMQEALLQNTDAQVASLLCQVPDIIAGSHQPQRRLTDNPVLRNIYNELDELHARSRDMLLSSPINMPLPTLPRFSGERQAFKADVRRELESWRERWPVFRPLLVPVKVTFLVIAPEQGKDLDNIALEVLPLVHEVLSPQQTPWLLRFPLLAAEEQKKHERDRERIRRLGDHSVTSFEVIELRRTQTDPRTGLLRLALGSGSQIGSTWTRISHDVEHRMESISD